MQLPNAQDTVATLLDPDERSRIDAVAQGCFAAVHTTSLGEAVRAVRERPVNAILVSPRFISAAETAAVARVARDFPGIPMVAVVSHHDGSSSENLLALGVSGVRDLVDLNRREGWQRLRKYVGRRTTICSRILCGIVPDLAGSSDATHRFFEVLVEAAPHTTTVRRFIGRFSVEPSTFMSRFFRAGLPSPKSYLTSARLLHAAALFEVPGLTISDIAYRLEYSSPQSFGRHVKSVLGLTASEFRRRMPFPTGVADFSARMILPYQGVLRTFHPF